MSEQNRSTVIYEKHYFENITKGNSENFFLNLIRRFVYNIQPWIRAIMIKIFLQPKKLLDVGCGTGRMLFHLRKFGIDAWGVEISDYTIRHADKKIRKYIIRGDILKVPFDNNSFDVVLTTSVMEHIDFKNIDKALIECYRVSKKFVLHKIYGTNAIEKVFPVNDSTHNTVKPKEWWENLFNRLEIKESDKILPRWEPGIFLLEK